MKHCCVPCNKKWLTWSAFIRHLVEFHHENRVSCWRRANQIGDAAAAYVESESGQAYMMVQGLLPL